MATRNFAKYLAAALAAVACTVQEPTDKQAPNPSEPVLSEGCIAGAATIQFDDSLLGLIEEDLSAGRVRTKSESLNTVLEDMGIESIEPVFPSTGQFEARRRRHGLHRYYTVTFRNDLPVTKAVTELSTVPGIRSVRPQRKITLRATFNDPRLGSQWHYINNSYQNADINVQEVWEKYTPGDAKVIVAVTDEPIDPNHSDLKANLWTDANGHTGYNFVRNSHDLSIRTGDMGHGTHVAGTIGAVNNNGVGVCGIAGGNAKAGIKGVRLMSTAIYSGYDSASDAKTANALCWGADHGAVISQNSWGYAADGCIDGEIDYEVSDEELAEYKSWSLDEDDVLRKAIDYFIDCAGCDDDGNQLPDSPMKGGLVFFAAGNEDIDYDIICDYDRVIAVGAFGLSGAKASYSNYGSWVDIAAPGGDGTRESNSIISTLPTSIARSGYGGNSWAGTSMACPHASGVAALIVSYFGGQGFTADYAKDILMSGLGKTIGGSRPIGKKLDALASFEYGISEYGGGDQPVPNREPKITLSASSLTVKAHETASASISISDPDGDELTLTCEEGSSALNFDPETMTLTIEGWSAPAGTYTASFTVSDGELSAQAQLSYILLPNHAPKVHRKMENILLRGLQRVGTVQPGSIFADEDGETLTLSTSISGDPCITLEEAEDRMNVLPVSFGRATVTLTATDFLGEEASTSFMVAVVDPSNPVTVSPAIVTGIASVSVETADLIPVSIVLYNALGGKVLEVKLEASAFYPAELDLSTFAPGRYTAEVSYEGKSRRVRIVKY